MLGTVKHQPNILEFVSFAIFGDALVPNLVPTANIIRH
jgi:hypothetical protein